MQISLRAVWLRLLLWLPLSATLLFFLFHAESIGLVSHLIRKSSFADGRLRVVVPNHWIVQCDDCTNDLRRIGFWAVGGRGLVRGWNSGGPRWWDEPFAHIEGHSGPDSGESLEWKLQHYYTDAKATALMDRRTSGGTFKCAEYNPNIPMDRIVLATCFARDEESKSVLELTYRGAPEMLPEFYSFLQTNVEISNALKPH